MKSLNLAQNNSPPLLLKMWREITLLLVIALWSDASGAEDSSIEIEYLICSQQLASTWPDQGINFQNQVHNKYSLEDFSVYNKFPSQ